MRNRSGVSDTDPDIERRLIEMIRATPDWVKFERIASMTATCRRLALIGLRDRYPQATEEELKLRLASLELDRETMIKVFHWDPQVEGY
ncbi:MAG TPA: hypothetical protein VJH03_22870 [Blastocatellia bacterium]|nr:hypothetical protein [Blastocatellia bacterium]